MQILCCRHVAMVTPTVSKIASIYSTDAIFLCQVEKKYDICINADVLPKCLKIGITVGSLLNNSYFEFTRWHYYLEYVFLYFLKLSASKEFLKLVICLLRRLFMIVLKPTQKRLDCQTFAELAGLNILRVWTLLKNCLYLFLTCLTICQMETIIPLFTQMQMICIQVFLI